MSVSAMVCDQALFSKAREHCFKASFHIDQLAPGAVHLSRLVAGPRRVRDAGENATGL